MTLKEKMKALSELQYCLWSWWAMGVACYRMSLVEMG